MHIPPNRSPNRSKKHPQDILSALGRQIKGLLTSPYGFAAIASLGVHGVVFAAIPQFTSVSFAAFGEDGGTEEERTVPLVTLSASEQGRLPNFNRPQLPSLPNPTSGLSTPPRALPNATLFTPSPRASLPSTRSSLGSRSTSRLTPRSQFRNPYIPRTPVNPPLRSRFSSPSRTTLIPRPPTTENRESRLERLERELAIERQAELDAKAAALAEEAGTEENTPDPDTEDPNDTLGQLEPAPGLPELPPAEAAALEGEGDPENAPEGSDPEGSDPELDGTELAANPETEALREPTHLERLQAKFLYDDTNTEPSQAAYDNWVVATAGDDDETIATAEPSELGIEANFARCPEIPPNDGEIGILVAPDGSVSDVTILRSTGYEHLNQAAQEALTTDAFPASETAVRYPFNVIVGYDAESCDRADDILETVQGE